MTLWSRISFLMSFGLILFGLLVPILGQGEEEQSALTLREIAREAPVWRGHALEVMRRYSADQFLYVGVGRSPTPLIAALKVVGGERAALNVPMSRLRKFGFEDQVSLEDMDDIRAAHWENLREHLKRFLPSKAELRGRRILLMDFCDTGTSLIAALPLLREFYREHYGPRENPVVGLGITGSEFAVLNLEANKIAVLAVDESIHERMALRQYRNFTEFDQFFVDIAGHGLKPKRHSDRFEKLKAAFRDSAESCEGLLKKANKN